MHDVLRGICNDCTDFVSCFLRDNVFQVLFVWGCELVSSKCSHVYQCISWLRYICCSRDSCWRLVNFDCDVLFNFTISFGFRVDELVGVLTSGVLLGCRVRVVRY